MNNDAIQTNIQTFEDMRKAERMYIASRIRHLVSETADELNVIVADENAYDAGIGLTPSQRLAMQLVSETCNMIDLIGTFLSYADKEAYRECMRFTDRFHTLMLELLGN